jgi:hypothetical protein
LSPAGARFPLAVHPDMLVLCSVAHAPIETNVIAEGWR